MSKIPYFFETPVPKYFRDVGWFENENTWKFVTWAFSRCSTREHVYSDGKTEIVLAPYEFICGRVKNSADCFLTEKQFRGQLFCMMREGILKKGANSRANQFSTYIWVTERFSNYEGQQKGRPRANRGPTEGHEQDIRRQESKRYKKETNKEKEIVAAVSLSPIHGNWNEEAAFQENQEPNEGLMAKEENIESLHQYLLSKNAGIEKATVRRWFAKYPLDSIIKNISLFIQNESKVRTPGAWIETALKDKRAEKLEIIEINRNFAVQFKETHKVSCLKINKQYCVDTGSGNDYQYSLDPEVFERELRSRYEWK